MLSLLFQTIWEEAEPGDTTSFIYYAVPVYAGAQDSEVRRFFYRFSALPQTRPGSADGVISPLFSIRICVLFLSKDILQENGYLRP